MERFLERDAVVEQLRRLARQSARGAGRVVLLQGEAGVGKTAVLAHFVGALDSSMRVLRGWCDPLAAPRPLGPLIDALAQLGDAQAAGLVAAVDAGDTAALYRRLLAVLRAEGRWVWLIEDAHWADGATLDLVRFVARRIDSLPLLLVVSHRDDELGAHHPLAVALGDVATCAAVNRIKVEPLSMAAVAVLAAGSGINADRLHRLTGGNPFFVTEILAAGLDVPGSDGLPRSVAEAVRGRLARLSDSGRETAHAVAVCGPRADVALVRKVNADAAAGLTECVDAGVLLADGAVVGFRHELARRATLAQIPDFDRIALHKQALTILEEPPVDPDTLAALAFHAEQAGDTEAAVRYGSAAAQRAAALGAHREAAGLYGLALRHADSAPAEQKVVWLEQHAFESYLCGQLGSAASCLRQAIEVRQRLGDRLAAGEDLRWLSEVLWPLGRTIEAIDTAAASVQLLEEVGPCKQLAWALVNLAQLSVFRYDPGTVELTARAITLGAELGDEGVVARARFYAALDSVLRTGSGWGEVEALWEQASNAPALIEIAGLTGAVACIFAALHRDLDYASRQCRQTVTFCRDHDLGMFEAIAIGAQALIALYRGQWAPAAAAAEEVLTRPGLPTLQRIMPLVTHALLRARRGQQPVGPLLDEAAEGTGHDVSRLALVWAARAEAAWLTGDDTTALAEAQTGLAAVTEDADPWLVGPLRCWIYRTGGAIETPRSDPRTPFELEISGDWRAAGAAWTDRGCPYDAAIALLGGDIAAVGSALATFRSLGARAAARRAQQRLTALRGRTPRSRNTDTLADPHGLTRRQREVLELLVDGRSSADIAACLHISPKTVDCHIGAVLAKLGVDNRAQAIAYAVQPQTSGEP